MYKTYTCTTDIHVYLLRNTSNTAAIYAFTKHYFFSDLYLTIYIYIYIYFFILFMIYPIPTNIFILICIIYYKCTLLIIIKCNMYYVYFIRYTNI